MSYEDSKNRSIAVSVGVQACVELSKVCEDPFETFAKNVDNVVQQVITLQAANALIDALPGSTIIPQSTPYTAAPPAAAPQAAYVPHQAAPAPAPIPGATDGDPATAAKWIEFFGDPTAWYDNRYDPGKPKGAPDFKHKTKKDGKYNVGVWVDDKKNPSWVKLALVEAGFR